MGLTRRRAMRWGYRLGAGVAYFTDPELGARRREDLLQRLESIGGRTRAAPFIAWLRELNEGRLGPPPGRVPSGHDERPEADAEPDSADEGGAERPDESGPTLLEPDSADPVAGAASGDGAVGELTVVEHHHRE